MTAILDERRLRAAVRNWSQECGRRIQLRRKELGWTQERLAQLVGVRHTTISKIELGLIVPKDAIRLTVAAALLCEVDDLWPYPQRSYIAAVAQTEAVA